MKCYYHPDKDAVGICKSCQKGICKDCLVDFGTGIACKGKCEEEVKILNELTKSSKHSYRSTSQTYFRNAIVFIILGLAFTFFGIKDLVNNKTGEPFSFLFLIMGVVLVLSAIFSYISSNNYSDKNIFKH